MTSLRKRTFTSPNEFTGDFDGQINLVNEQFSDYFRLRAADPQTISASTDYKNAERGAVGCQLWPLSMLHPFDMTIKNTTTPSNPIVADSRHTLVAPLNQNPVDLANGTPLTGTVSPNVEIPNTNMYSNMYSKCRVEKTKFSVKLLSGEPIPLLVGYSIFPRFVQMIGSEVITPEDHAGTNAASWYPLGKGVDSLPEQPLTYVLGKMPAAKRLNNTDNDHATDMKYVPVAKTFSFSIDPFAVLKRVAKHTHPHGDIDLNHYTALYGNDSNPDAANDLICYFWAVPFQANVADYGGTRATGNDTFNGILVEAWSLGGGTINPWTSRIWVSVAAEQQVRLLDSKRPLDILTTIPDVDMS